MSEADSGIDVMRARIERGRRRPPQPRRPAEGPSRESSTPAAVQPAGRPAAPPPTPALAARRAEGAPEEAPATTGSRRRGRERLRLSASLPWANLAIRVRRPLDERLADLIYELRRSGVRTSKVEIIEMLLWELEPDDLESVRARLARFRRHAPRGASAELED